jgi:Mobilization protein NikA
MKRSAGRPKQEITREVNMALRLTTQEKAELQDAARRAGLSMASWLRERVLWVLRQEQADPYPHGPSWPKPARPTKRPPGERLSHD